MDLKNEITLMSICGNKTNIVSYKETFFSNGYFSFAKCLMIYLDVYLYFLSIWIGVAYYNY